MSFGNSGFCIENAGRYGISADISLDNLSPDGFGVSEVAAVVLSKVTVQTIEVDKGEDLPGDVEQRDSLVVVTKLAVPLLLVEMDDGGVLEILRDLSLASDHLEEHCDLVHQLGATMLVDLQEFFHCQLDPLLYIPFDLACKLAINK
ncbi:unnamed protein product [Schistocephalus solidus]|uniref:Uncharacterized protein n=1 Tax=Schistocephalus solidus TaxID=70667 RepID=A0A183S886_SCHSO|nr:unnamed protein product [Schistocephalus solidus]